MDGCDLCILLVAYRRGHVPIGEMASITQLEYREAMAQGIDVLVFLLAANEPWQDEWNELANDAELIRWRGELAERRGVSTFHPNPDSIRCARPDTLDRKPAVARL